MQSSQGIPPQQQQSTSYQQPPLYTPPRRLRRSRWILITLASLLCLSFIAGGISTVYASQQGYAQGHQQGYAQGHQQGYTTGHTQGESDGYNRGYVTGQTDGYQSGDTQGKQDELATIQDWYVNTGCEQTTGGYIYFKIWKDYQGNTQYTCLVNTW